MAPRNHGTDYAVYSVMPRSPDDPDLYLLVTYKDMAAMDGLADRLDAIQEKTVGSRDVRDQQTIAHGEMRTMVGTEMIRQLVLK